MARVNANKEKENLLNQLEAQDAEISKVEHEIVNLKRQKEELKILLLANQKNNLGAPSQIKYESEASCQGEVISY